MDIDRLRYDIVSCMKCPLGPRRIARSTYDTLLAVPAEAGDRYRPGGLGILAEAPGSREEQTGRPMQGGAGKLVDQMLDEVGLSRGQVVILNRLRCRPPDNNIKSKEAVAGLVQCDPWLVAELEAYDPSVVLVMGGTALSAIFGKKLSVTKTRGKVRHTGPDFTYGERTWVATAHPAAVLHGGTFWLPLIMSDLQLAKTFLTSSGALTGGLSNSVSMGSATPSPSDTIPT